MSNYNTVHEKGKVGTGQRSGAWELYDLEADCAERSDLSKVDPRRLRAMIERHRDWQTRVGATDWEAILQAGGFHQGG